MTTARPEPGQPLLPTPSPTYMKLMPAAQAHAIAQEGAVNLTGPVVLAEDLEAVTNPADLRRRFGVEGNAWYADPHGDAYVLRFPSEPLMRLTDPRERPAGSGPAYWTGFLPAPEIVPVWWLEYTRVPIGSTVWRLRSGREPEGLAVYRSLAQGWQGAQGYTPPSGLNGPRAQWRVLDLPAALTNDGVEIVSTEQQPGMQQASTGMWQTVLSREDVEAIFEIVLRCEWKGQEARVIRVEGGQALLLLERADADAARAVGGSEVEPGVFQVIAPKVELMATKGVRNELPTPQRQR